MDIKQLIALAQVANKPSGNFAMEDATSAFRNALLEFAGLEEGFTIRDLRANPQLFALIEEITDEMLPAKLEEYIGTFAEIKTVARDAELVYKIKNINANRVSMGIGKASRGGIYKARRLDNYEMALQAETIGVAYMATLEDIILGKSTIADLVELIAKGMADQVFIRVIEKVRALYGTLLPNNKAVATDDTLAIGAALDKVIKTIKSYGSPMILAFDATASKILTVVGDSTVITQNVSSLDIESIRTTGYVQNYKGNVPIVLLPNYFIDETNDKKYFKENDIWVLPISEKPVKVAFRGEAWVQEIDQAAGGKEYHTHKIVGIGILYNNQVGMVRVGASETADDVNGLW